jgi:hypothetical protein
MKPIRIAGKSGEVEEARHPFWFIKQLPDSPEKSHMIASMTKDLERLQVQQAEFLATGEWGSYVFSFPRPLRLQAFWEIIGRLTDREYWTLLGDLWTDTEMPNANRAYWLELFLSPRGERDQLMKSEEHAALTALADPVRIWRGASRRYARGMSWTVDEQQAAK